MITSGGDDNGEAATNKKKNAFNLALAPGGVSGSSHIGSEDAEDWSCRKLSFDMMIAQERRDDHACNAGRRTNISLSQNPTASRGYNDNCRISELGVSDGIRFQNQLLCSKMEKINEIYKEQEVLAVLDSAKVETNDTTEQIMREIDSLGNKIRTLKADITSTNGIVDLESDFELEDFVESGKTKYYRLKFNPKYAGFCVLVKAVTGDPDLFICQRNFKPSKMKHTWRSVSEGKVDMVTVPAGSPAFKLSHVYIGINGHEQSQYKLTATWIKNKNNKSSEPQRVFMGKKIASVRVAEKIEARRAAYALVSGNRAKQAQFQQQQQPDKPQQLHSSTMQSPRKRSAHEGNYSVKNMLIKDLAKFRMEQRCSGDGMKHPQRPSSRATVKMLGIKTQQQTETCERSAAEAEKQRPLEQRQALQTNTQFWSNGRGERASRTGKSLWCGLKDFVTTVSSPTGPNHDGFSNSLTGTKWQFLPKKPNKSVFSLRPGDGASNQRQRAEQAHFERELDLCRRHGQKRYRALCSSFAKSGVVTELGGLSLEVPVQTQDPWTMNELMRKQHFVPLKKKARKKKQQQQQQQQQYELFGDQLKVHGRSEQQMKMDHQVITARRGFTIFRRS